MMRRLLVIATAAAALSLAACANGAGDEAGAPAPAPASSATPSVPAGEPSVPSETGVPSEPGGATTTLTGTIKAGVEPNCLMLDDHLLLFDDPALKSQAKAGAKVTVTGRVAEGMMTTCMQGTPFRVSQIRAD